MSNEDLEKYEAEIQLTLVREYRDVMPMFSYVVETERRFYLANKVEKQTDPVSGFVSYLLTDAWVWDMYRQSRFLASVEISSARGISIEKLPEADV